MAVFYDRFVGFVLVIMSVLGITGTLVEGGSFLGLLTVTDANQLFYLACGSAMMVFGFECQDFTARRITLAFSLLFMAVALAAIVTPGGDVLGVLTLSAPADIAFPMLLSMAGFTCTLPSRRQTTHF